VQLIHESFPETKTAEVVAHATPDNVRGKHVIGVLPLGLAALAESVTEAQLELAPEDRGRELNLDETRARLKGWYKYTIKGEQIRFFPAEGNFPTGDFGVISLTKGQPSKDGFHFGFSWNSGFYVYSEAMRWLKAQFDENGFDSME